MSTNKASFTSIIGLFTDTAATSNSNVLKNYYGMPKGQLHACSRYKSGFGLQTGLIFVYLVSNYEFI